MKQNKTVMYGLAGFLWTVQTLLSLVNIFTSELETIGIIVGIGIALLYAICAFALFTGDTYKFYTASKILSIIVSIAVGIVAISILRLLAYIPGIVLGMLILLAMIAIEYWSLTYVSEKADDNEPLDKCWIYPGVIYLVTIIITLIFVNALENNYGLRMDMAGSLLSDNLIILVLGTLMFFFTGYAFYDAQKNAPPATTGYQQGNNNTPQMPINSDSVFGNLYSNNYNRQNINNQFSNNSVADTQNVQNTSDESNPDEAPKASSSGGFTLKKD